jgi:hypothetical protein
MPIFLTPRLATLSSIFISALRSNWRIWLCTSKSACFSDPRENDIQPTAQPTECDVLYDLRGIWQSSAVVYVVVKPNPATVISAGSVVQVHPGPTILSLLAFGSNGDGAAAGENRAASVSNVSSSYLPSKRASHPHRVSCRKQEIRRALITISVRQTFLASPWFYCAVNL